jgi:hypothetical protein
LLHDIREWFPWSKLKPMVARESEIRFGEPASWQVEHEPIFLSPMTLSAV